MQVEKSLFPAEIQKIILDRPVYSDNVGRSGALVAFIGDELVLKRTEKGWTLGVHIADVSHYVRQGTPTEEEAVLRGTSVYFTDKVVPMLPQALSNGACSLNAGTDKYALSAEITLDPMGKRLSTRVFKSLIRSAVRGVYEEVNDLFEKGFF